MANSVGGKLRLDAEVYFLTVNEKVRVEDAKVYFHLKGYQRARVTHLDVENRVIGKIIHRGRGNMLEIQGIKGGIRIHPKEEREITLGDKKIKVKELEICCPLLNKVLKPGETTRTWVGRKFDGIYVGFRKNEVSKIERTVEKEFGVKPLKHLEKKPEKVRKSTGS